MQTATAVVEPGHAHPQHGKNALPPTEGFAQFNRFGHDGIKFGRPGLAPLLDDDIGIGRPIHDLENVLVLLPILGTALGNQAVFTGDPFALGIILRQHQARAAPWIFPHHHPIDLDAAPHADQLVDGGLRHAEIQVGGFTVCMNPQDKVTVGSGAVSTHPGSIGERGVF